MVALGEIRGNEKKGKSKKSTSRPIISKAEHSADRGQRRKKISAGLRKRINRPGNATRGFAANFGGEKKKGILPTEKRQMGFKMKKKYTAINRERKNRTRGGKDWRKTT